MGEAKGNVERTMFDHRQIAISLVSTIVNGQAGSTERPQALTQCFTRA